ncbi:hypothetical protein WS90_03735 [Burkholderia cepacia]|uniref:Uncharacterized protein n=1 Tax=Burkholderia cepacia TaxID=292 RepID=A0A118KCG2_BURCE|nr:hypothetical protein [Burkholderia cepacia]KVK72541.1 hypothetical protein WS90_03735 [Burkholderia cepacia]
MDARDDLVSALEEIPNDGQWDQVLSAFRERLSTILHAKFNEAESRGYLMAYDLGVASGLYGPDSAVCVGMKRGVDDAVHVSPVGLSLNLLGKAEELGRKHGTLTRSMKKESALLSDGDADGLSSDPELPDKDRCVQAPSA